MAIIGPYVSLRDDPLDPLDPADVLTAKMLREFKQYPDPEFRQRHGNGRTTPIELARVIAKATLEGRL